MAPERLCLQEWTNNSITYTSQNGELTTENFRYQNGHLVEVTLPDGTSIFRLDGENGMGLPTLVQTK